MALETGTYISDLTATNPVAGDPVSQADDHLRLIKSTVKATFPNVSGAVTPTHTELNYVVGVTSAIQTQLNAKLATTLFPNVSGAANPTQTELNYVVGVTSAIQTQLAAKVPTTFFPNVSGAANPTQAQLNFVVGVTSAIQTQLDAKFATSGGAIAGPAYTTPVSVAFSATPTFNAALSNVFYLAAMTANVTTFTISNPSDGQSINIRFVQDGTGSRTVTLPATVKASGAADPTLSRASWLVLIYVSSASRWEGSWTAVGA